MVKIITLYKRFKYSNKYDYIKTFSTKTEQNAYFNGLEKIYYDEDGDYIREGEPFLVEYSHKYLVENNVNYIKYNNGYRDIYAFIVDKRYINDEVTEITHEVDVIQTFMFDFNVDSGFIERKHCSIDDIVDFDDGIECGEHDVVKQDVMLTKSAQYFAIFNGIKQQELSFDSYGNVTNVSQLPYNTLKPMTLIDGIQYPLYFMPLQDSYQAASVSQIGKPGGETFGGTISAKILRFIKGYEGFAEYPNYFNGEDFRTYGYGITELYQAAYFTLLGDAPCSEQKASEILAQMMNNEFAYNLYYRMLQDGCTAQTIKQKHFDAFLSLAMNGGLGAVTSSPMYTRYLVNPEDAQIPELWLSWYTHNMDGEELPGLIARRQEEANIYSNGVYNYRAIGIYGSMGTIVGTVADNNGHGYIPSTVNGEV